MVSLHRALLTVLLLGNAVAFAGVDPPTRLVTAVIAVVLMADLRRIPEVPQTVRIAAWGFLALAVIQLVPLPVGLRRLLQPGFSEFMTTGWGVLSLAPWSTIRVVGSMVVAAAVALTAARMAVTRSGLPVLLGVIATTCGVVALLGLAGESGAPERVLLIRANTGGGDVYGPFVNSNQFAACVELGLPAALVLLAAALRNLGRPGVTRQRAVVVGFASSVVAIMATAAVMRSSSRGGLLFLGVAAVVTAAMWMPPGRRLKWPWVFVGAALLIGALALAWTRLPEVRDGFSSLLVVEGVEGNTRWDLWAGTARSWSRSPVIGSGLGSYRHVIGLDKPATGTAVLEQAHNDWLEWASTTGLVGVAVLVLLLFGVLGLLRPQRVRRLRFELRYPLAGATLALVATALHETVGFGLQTPLNRYLMAAWLGLIWGVWNRVEEGRQRAARTPSTALKPENEQEPSVDETLGKVGDHRDPSGDGDDEDEPGDEERWRSGAGEENG
jgi:O-antigen ligase